jgi:hypothetical protein
MHPMCIRPGSHLISLPVYKWSESVIIESIEWNRNLKYASLYYLPCKIFHVLLNLKLIETRFVEKDKTTHNVCKTFVRKKCTLYILPEFEVRYVIYSNTSTCSINDWYYGVYTLYWVFIN